MLLQLSHFFLHFIPLHPAPPPTSIPPPLSLCPWVLHISSLASPFPILFLTPTLYFVPTIYASFFLYIPSVIFPPPALVTLHVISNSVVLFLF